MEKERKKHGRRLVANMGLKANRKGTETDTMRHETHQYGEDPLSA